MPGGKSYFYLIKTTLLGFSSDKLFPYVTFMVEKHLSLNVFLNFIYRDIYFLLLFKMHITYIEF